MCLKMLNTNLTPFGLKYRKQPDSLYASSVLLKAAVCWIEHLCESYLYCYTSIHKGYFVNRVFYAEAEFSKIIKLDERLKSLTIPNMYFLIIILLIRGI